MISLAMPATVLADLNGDLRKAAKQGDTEEIQSLLEAGAIIDAADRRGRTALLFAVEEGRLNAVRLLLDSGADVLAMGRRAERAIQKVRDQSDGELVDVLNTALSDRLADAVESGPFENIERLIALGADVNVKNSEGEPALHLANMLKEVDILLQHGADVDARDANGKTALHRAARRGDQTVIDMLVSYGADVDIKDKDGMTALMFPVQLSHRDAKSVLALLSAGADVTIADNEGKTALDHTHPHSRNLLALLADPKPLGTMEQDEVAEVALRDGRPEVREEALNRLRDRNLVVRVAQQAGLSSETARLAGERLLALDNLTRSRLLQFSTSGDGVVVVGSGPSINRIGLAYFEEFIDVELLLLDPEFVDAFGELRISNVAVRESGAAYSRSRGIPSIRGRVYSTAVTITIGDANNRSLIRPTFRSRSPAGRESFPVTARVGATRYLHALIDISEIRRLLEDLASSRSPSPTAGAPDR